MDVKVFQRTQRDLATAINLVIDRYWANEITEPELMGVIKELFINNQSKFLKEDKFTTVLRQQCGKRRLEIVSRILGVSDKTIK